MARKLTRGLCGAVLLVLPVACRGVLGIEEARPLTGDDDGGIASEAGASPEDRGACTADLQRDQGHCGRCGHDCGGGACVAGRCRPKEIGQGAASIAAGPGGVAWTVGLTFGAVDLYACPGTCTKPARRIRPGLSDANGLGAYPDLVVGEKDVYFLDGAQLWHLFRCPLDGCANPFDMGDGAGIPFFVSEALRVYAYDFAPNGDDCQGTFKRGFIHVGSPDPLSPGCTDDLHLTATTFFHLDNSRILYRCPASGCGGGPGTLVAESVKSAAFAGERAYWIDQTTSTISSCEGGDCATGGRRVSSERAAELAADGERLYFIDDTRRSVRSCRASDAKCTPEEMFESAEALSRLRVGAHGVYFAGGDRGSIYQLAKP